MLLPPPPKKHKISEKIVIKPRYCIRCRRVLHAGTFGKRNILRCKPCGRTIMRVLSTIKPGSYV